MSFIALVTGLLQCQVNFPVPSPRSEGRSMRWVTSNLPGLCCR